jgi:pimeloyl-ACP methyl ester carboxylesterase
MRRLQLSDGRTLAWLDLGEPDAPTLFYFHGFPGSRLEVALAESVLSRERFRLIAVDRPGMGQSSFQPNRRLADWPRDVRELADSLGCERFAVLGVSGGGPYALACARYLPERLTAVGVVAGLGLLDGEKPTAGMIMVNRLGLRLAKLAPDSTRVWVRLPGMAIRWSPEWCLRLLALQVAPADRACLSDPQVRKIMVRSMREAVAQGSRGLAQDLAIYASPWSFNPADINCDVRLWHGADDRVVPQHMGRRLADLIPGCRSHFPSGEGHFSLILRYAGEIVGELLRA